MHSMTFQAPVGLSLSFALILLLLATRSSAAPSPKPSILTCQARGNHSRLPHAANDTGFLTWVNNPVCVQGDIVELYCSPMYRDGTFWTIWNSTTECFADGSQDLNGSTLVLPCGSYTLQCVSSGVHSEHIEIRDITAVEPTIEQCHEDRNSTASFHCPALPHATIALWFVGDKEVSPSEYISSDGRRLDVPCIQKYNNTEVWCQVQLRAGIANRPAGRLLLYPAEKGLQTETEEFKTERPYLISLTAGQFAIAVASIVAIASIATSCFVVWGLYNCIRLRKVKRTAKVSEKG